MAYKVELADGEKVELDIVLNLSKKAVPFHFAVTNQAIYVPRVKLIAKSDPYYFQKLGLGEVQEVVVRRLRPYMLWLLGAIMVVAGLVTTVLMMEPLLKKAPGTHEVSGWPIAVFVGGLLVPIAARGRFGLEILFRGGKFRWKPPLVVDSASKNQITETFESIVQTCEKVKARVIDERRG